MNKQVRNRDRKIAMLLIAAFAWLFIGSLIIFHQEHVLGKHILMNNHLFITPKSKDKQHLTTEWNPTTQPFQHLNGFEAVSVASGSLSLFSFYTELKFNEPSSAGPDDVFLTFSPLRAPPVA
jgi:hypothetical protein